MKKVIAVLLVLAISMTFFACSPKKDGDGSKGDKNSTSTVMKNDNVSIDGLYVDNSYVDKDGSPLKMVYLFLTVTATDKNLQVDSKYLKMTFNDANSYDSEFYKDTCTYAPSYYYSSFIEDVYVGNSIKLALTFKIPEGDLTGGKKITFTDSAIPVDGLKMTTDNIIFCKNVEEICEKADPTGYAQEMDKHAPADEATVKKVKAELNGYYWEFYVTAGTTVQAQEIEFMAPNKFEMRTKFGSNGGTYEVKKAFIYVTYSTNNATYKIPYEFKNGELILDCATAFSIYE